ncbi:hypothetical protein A5712_05120 [Mycobacterium sp. E2327]|uniref:AAA family ATPase n=1 Tax=Mycobacterium sp. E2327 TaxID=1834132 RepID=UPI0007FD5102|nr:AAA family ATPase [Mycobacterium sp. E2327]OBI13386.1 hypothetical protein A5712_05120 [Mycobacterium sp. E2327]
MTDESLRETIQSALASWDQAHASRAAAEAGELRNQFVAQFPLDGWGELPLEQYALGQGVEGTVSWWLEYKTRPVASMGGGTAKKHLIYRRPDGSWYYPRQYGSVEQAWEAIRSGCVEMLALADRGLFDETDQVQALTSAAMLRGKLLYLYFPRDLLPVLSKAHLDHFLRSVGQATAGLSAIRANRQLLAALRQVPELAQIDTHELMSFLYHWSDPLVGVVQVAPAESAWADCLSEGYVAVGWDQVGDLSRFENNQAFRAAFREHYPAGEAKVMQQSEQLWKLTELQTGDKVIANRGVDEVLAVGTVTDTGYVWRPERGHDKHTVGVDWDTSLARMIEPVRAWRTTTVSDVSASLYRRILGGATPSQPVDVDPLYRRIEEALTRRGQVILYGPPGTGKTHTARRLAVWLLDGGSVSMGAADLLSDHARFLKREAQVSSARSASRQVWFVVANPAHWQWNRLFQDGSVEFEFGNVQRNYPQIRAGDLVIGYESAPTKRIAALARMASEYDEKRPEAAFTLEPVTPVRDGLTYDELRGDPVLAGSEPARIRCRGTLFKLTPVEADRIVKLLAARDPNVASVVEPSIQLLTRITFHPSYTYEDFIEGYRPVQSAAGTLELSLSDGVFKQVCTAAGADRDQYYIVLIDEINRGNIPKIFGELITLIERDKRGLSVRLPQSGDEFAVPPNVLIVATMNTADRSIHLLDTALRRRFSFVELLPDAGVLTGATVGALALDLFLINLNECVRERVGREKQVGHAMFLTSDNQPIDSAEAFAAVFRYELLPLLQEYLYEDYKELNGLLGGVIDTGAERPSSIVDDPEALCAELANQFNAHAAG